MIKVCFNNHLYILNIFIIVFLCIWIKTQRYHCITVCLFFNKIHFLQMKYLLIVSRRTNKCVLLVWEWGYLEFHQTCCVVALQESNLKTTLDLFSKQREKTLICNKSSDLSWLTSWRRSLNLTVSFMFEQVRMIIFSLLLLQWLVVKHLNFIEIDNCIDLMLSFSVFISHDVTVNWY